MNFVAPLCRWMPALVSFALLLLPLHTALALDAAPEAADAAPVSIEADTLSYDKAAATYQAVGQVHLQKGELSLNADQVEWNTETGDAIARGEVRVVEPSGEMSAAEMRFNLDSGRGHLREARIFLKEHNFHLAGDEIEKFDELRYRLTGGTFTTCDGEKPSWKFAANRLDVTVGRYARARHVLFYIRDIPVLYIPYIIYPVKTERESGMLMPRFGISRKRGTQLSLAYYQVLGRNMDATVYLDYFSDLGVGKGVEYRYILGEDNDGLAKFYHVSGLKDADNRYAIDWQHMGTLPGRVRLTADVEYVSSRDYFEDFGEVAEEYTRDKAQSVVAASRNWEKINLTGQLKYTKDLQQSNDQTLQRLPEIDLTAVRQRLAESPFYLGVNGTSTYFWRKEGVKGERLTLRPALSAFFHPGQILEISPEVGFLERLYWTSDEGPGFEKEGLYDFSTRISTRFSRVFSTNGRLIKKVRHSVEPEVIYSYIPPENQAHLPQFDARDNIGPRNMIAYALTNRFTAKLEPENGEVNYHEFLYLRLSQEYDIRESRRDQLNPQDQLRPFSDIRAELIARPTRWSFLDVDARYDVNSAEDGLSNRFLVFNARGGVQDGAGNALHLDYRFRQEDIEYVAANLDLAWLKPFYVNYQHRYDFAGDRDLEKVLNLEYRAQCWSLFLTLRDRLEDREYLITFSLTGLGKVAGFGGDFGRPTE
ncbi:MAG TPA: LPS assembly protein LptD [Desulfuromonadales bacterium]|nr:LPS assembly protein LptD [Desulfuromonadales bacterium]